MNGVTGRMGTNQHLLRSIVPIMQQGGVKLSDTEYILPEPVLVGRNKARLQALAERSGIKDLTTDLDAVLQDKKYNVYFDAQTTGMRAGSIQKAVAAGKHIYCEKPIASSPETAMELYRLCEKAGVKHGVVQDKLWLPGLLRLKRLIQQGFSAAYFR